MDIMKSCEAVLDALLRQNVLSIGKDSEYYEHGHNCVDLAKYEVIRCGRAKLNFE